MRVTWGLRRRQQQLFVEGRDITAPDLLAATADELGLPGRAVREAMADAGLAAELEAEFDRARSYGTNAMPSVVVELDGERELLAGGYADGAMLESLVRGRLARHRQRG